MAKMGRPKIEINFEDLEKLCQMQCTLVEVAGFFQCSEDTIVARIKEETGETFSVFFKKHSQGGIASLRRAQFQKALGGNVAMLIWLGKQYLGQSEKVEEKIDGTWKLEVEDLDVGTTDTDNTE